METTLAKHKAKQAQSKKDRIIERVSQEQTLTAEFAEYRAIQSKYGGAVAELAADVLIGMWARR